MTLGSAPARSDVGDVLAQVDAVARKQVVRVVGARARAVVQIGPLEAEVAVHLGVAALALVARARDAGAGLRGDPRHVQDPVAVEDDAQHLVRRARVVPADRGPGREVDAGGLRPLVARIRRRAEPGVVALAGERPEAVELGPALRVERLDPARRDLPVLGVGPGARRGGPEPEREHGREVRGEATPDGPVQSRSMSRTGLDVSPFVFSKSSANFLFSTSFLDFSASIEAANFFSRSSSCALRAPRGRRPPRRTCAASSAPRGR